MRVYTTPIRRVSALLVIMLALVAVVPAKASETAWVNLPSGSTANVYTAWRRGDLAFVKVSDTRVDVCAGWGVPEYTIWRSGNDITLGNGDCVIIRGRSGIRVDYRTWTHVVVW